MAAIPAHQFPDPHFTVTPFSGIRFVYRPCAPTREPATIADEVARPDWPQSPRYRTTLALITALTAGQAFSFGTTAGFANSSINDADMGNTWLARGRFCPRHAALGKGNLMDGMKRFGEYAVDLGYCTTDDVHRAVGIQDDLVKRGFPRMLIGLVMVRYGIIDTGQLLNILKMLDTQHVPSIIAG